MEPLGTNQNGNRLVITDIRIYIQGHTTNIFGNAGCV